MPETLRPLRHFKVGDRARLNEQHHLMQNEYYASKMRALFPEEITVKYVWQGKTAQFITGVTVGSERETTACAEWFIRITE